MEIGLTKYANEILDFLCEDTLYAIDCGILDLGHIKNVELKEVFYYLEELLTVELLLNYRQNSTGIFRVYRFGDIWCYCERHCVITGNSFGQLREKVISQNRIWYVFDETLAKRSGGLNNECR